MKIMGVDMEKVHFGKYFPLPTWRQLDRGLDTSRHGNHCPSKYTAVEIKTTKILLWWIPLGVKGRGATEWF